MMGIQKVLKVGGLAGKGCMIPKFPVPPRSFPNTVKGGCLSAVQAKSSPEGKKALPERSLRRREGVVAEEPQDTGDGCNSWPGIPKFPRDNVSFFGVDLSGCFAWGEPPPVPGEPDVVPNVNELQECFCPF